MRCWSEKLSSQMMKASMMSFCSGVIWYFSARMKSLASRPGALERELVMSTWSFFEGRGEEENAAIHP
jgi:hypothetical protein